MKNSFFGSLLAALLVLGGVAVSRAADPEGPPPTKVPAGRSWQARWIWTKGDPAPRHSYTYFRKSLTLDSTPREAKVFLTADSRYQLWVNGEFVGRGPVRSDQRWLYYDTWDVTPKLKKGENVIAVLVHQYGEFTFQYQKGRGGLLAEVVTNGTRTVAKTDGSWKALRSQAWGSVFPGGMVAQPRMSIQLGYSEVYDARQEPKGWTTTAFKDQDWTNAHEIGAVGMEPWRNLVPRDIPPMNEEPMAAARILEVTEAEAPPAAQYVDLLPLMEPKNWGVAYLATMLHSPDERSVTLKFGSDDALKVWLNGQEIVSQPRDRAAAPDQESAIVTLRPGANRLLAKVVQGHSKWEYYFRITGPGAEGVTQQTPGVSNPNGARGWAVVGPFPFPEDTTLARGFDTAFPPETNTDPAARFRTGSGTELSWRPVTAAPSQFEHVSQLMAAEARRPLANASIADRERVIQDGPRGAMIRTTPGADLSLLIDFGKEVTGFPRFRVWGAKGGEVIDMGYGEVLHGPNGAYLPQHEGVLGRLNPDRDGVHYADRYLCRPGEQEFQTFDKRGFRYLQLDVRNAPQGIELDNVGIVFSTFPVKYQGAFRCSDERLNKIWEIGRWTCQLNMEDGYTDCPWRERAQWWGDARVEGLINYYAFGDTTLIKKCLRQQGQSLNAEGITWGVYPTDWDGGRLPSFTLIWVSTLWDYYQHTGDDALVRELFPKVRYTLDRFFAPKVGSRGLLKDVPYWVFIDWADVETAGEGGALNAYYYDALRRTAEMARLIGNKSAGEYEQRATAVKTALNQHLWDGTAHAYRDSIRPDGQLSPKFSQQTNSLCLLFDIAPEAEREKILGTIYDPANIGKVVVEAGSPYFSYYQLAALYHVDRHEQALEYIRKKWGVMLDWGATTWWEMWAPGASFCHGWSGGPTYDLQAEFLGIQPLKPGFAEVSVTPRLANLQWASGVVPTAKGEVKVAWQRDDRTRSLAIRAETPPKVPVEVTVPAGGKVRVNKKDRLPREVEQRQGPNGTTIYRSEKGGQLLLEIRDR